MSDTDFGATFDADIHAALDSVFASDEATSAPVSEDTASAPDETPAPTDDPPAPAEDAAAAASVETPAETPAPTPTISDDTVIEVMVNGEAKPMTLGEARKGFMMHAAFTQKTQAVAEERKQIAALRAQAEQAIAQAANFQQQFTSILQDPMKLAAAYTAAQARQQGQAAPAAVAPPAPAPVDPAALRDQILNDVFSTIATRQQTDALEQDVTTFTKGLLSDDPVLSAIDGIEDLIYERVAKMSPTSPDEAKTFIRIQIEGTKAKLAERQTQQAKATAVAKAKAVTGIERGGSPVIPTKPTYENFDSMEKDMLAFLDRAPAGA